MAHHVIVGGGPAATNCIETIRQFDAGSSQITLVSDEPAHSRMALPYWLAGQIPRDHVLTGDDAYFRGLGVETRFGERVNNVDPAGKLLTLRDGGSIEFDDLLIATGSSPVKPSIPGVDLAGVQPMWSLADTQAALDAAGGVSNPRIALVGAGFIGFIVLGAMYKRGWRLAVIEREQQVLPRMLDSGAASIVQKWLTSKGVDVHCGTTVRAITETGDAKSLELADGERVEADLAIVATGIRPNLTLIDGSGIDVDQGILVNKRMQTNFPHVYAGGDVAQGPLLYGNGPAIHAIQPTAVDHGRVAGANMAGQEVEYPGSLSMNVVDVCGLQCASFGDWSDASAEATTIANAEGFIYRKLLWRGDHIVGAIFLGRANDMGMLNDVGMLKGILQTRTALGLWKDYLVDNPFDIRRPYVAVRVAEKLAGATLLGRPAVARGYRYGGAQVASPVGDAHRVYVGTKQD